MSQRLIPSLFLTLAFSSVDLAAQSTSWSTVTTPNAGIAQSIGTYTSGCVSGAKALPLNGDGYQVMRISRQRYFGHPKLVAFIEQLGHQASSAKLGTLLIGDLGQARGGPMVSGHRSHQTGLDVDIWFLLSEQANQRLLTDNERENWSAPSIVNMQAEIVDDRQWSLAHAHLLELAARHPDVDRVFVHASIKQALCQMKPAGANEWLRKIRPWWKHDDHFHVRLKCPDNNPNCARQEALPAGDGCDASLSWWFSAEAKLPSKAKPVPPPPLPAMCEAVLRE
ncbi:MAG: hypothetical protein RL563_1042 [Pseudomonadota bacterium]|jgi:penicillin-insensitive murein endopeptidase